MSPSLEHQQKVVTELINDYCLFWLAFSGDPKPDCDTKKFSAWECCPYHQLLSVKHQEIQQRMNEVSKLTGVKSAGQTGSQTWWEDLMRQVNLAAPEIYKVYRRQHDLAYFQYLYLHYDLESVIWILEDSDPEVVFSLARQALPTKEATRIEEYTTQLVNKYGLKYIRECLKVVFENRRGRRFQIVFRDLPVTAS